MLYELILINEIEQRAKIIFLSVMVRLKTVHLFSIFRYVAFQNTFLLPLHKKYVIMSVFVSQASRKLASRWFPQY